MPSFLPRQTFFANNLAFNFCTSIAIIELLWVSIMCHKSYMTREKIENTAGLEYKIDEKIMKIIRKEK